MRPILLFLVRSCALVWDYASKDDVGAALGYEGVSI